MRPALSQREDAAAADGARTLPAGPLLLVLTVVLLVALMAAVASGSTSVPPAEVWHVIGRRLSGDAPRPGTDDLIVWQLRVPRALLAAPVGAGLGLAGTAVQALVRNPLADPCLLGVSNGASLGAVAALVLGLGTGGALGLGLSAAAFAGALATYALVWAVAARRGGFAALRLVLAGVAIGQFLSGFTSCLVLRAGDEQQTHSVLFWLMGSLGGANWDLLAVPAVAVPGAWLCLQARARGLNALLMGDETAAGLGVDVGRLRRELFAVTSVLTGVLVAVSGAIAFVALMVPHVCRLLVGGDHRRLLPVSAPAGAVLLVVVDIVCRTAMETQELPVGVVTSLLGAPALLYLPDRRLGSDS
ncbi:ABC transporter permease [Streptomyces sp. IMTB 2501]|uniref:FecCD family ABC transporter permease n=1 Tax=Streptomyces sp. IMTB 2501 TaxID=1776340 RepID=UPI00096D08AE|nr:iron ABC transporter permease [Streptomyces sp. IMTB 2501]OLZ62481.1 ABC transporter permease [Streptomyces sp. IMTB 2501]